MKTVIVVAVVLFLTALIAVSASGSDPVQAQGGLSAPSNVRVQDTGNPGEVTITWDPVPGVQFYRIGWVTRADVAAVIAAGHDWLEAFAFVDIANRGLTVTSQGQNSYTISRLSPGVEYAFLVASNGSRYGEPSWPPVTGWVLLTLAADPSPTPTVGTASVDLEWETIPTARYYRIGWVTRVDVGAATAAGRHWLEAFVFVDIANRNQTTYTVGRLTPGIEYAFLVAGNSSLYGEPNWPPADAWQFITPGETQPEPMPVQPGVDQPPCPPPEWTAAARPTSTIPGDYDADDDGLIEVATLAQLDAIRYDPSGTGSPRDDEALGTYFGAFPNAIPGMGCPADGCAGYELVADLDFDTNGNGRADAGDTYWNDGAGWLPIDDYYRGFDGGGHTISNLYIDAPRPEGPYSPNRGVGLFGNRFRGWISSVALPSVHVSGKYPDSVGALVGYGSGGSNLKITDSCVSGTVTGRSRVGGMAGAFDGFRVSISGSFATGTVTGFTAVGGLVGSGYVAGHGRSSPDSGQGVSISQSYAVSEVTGHSGVGGLVGEGANSINESYATGTVTGTNDGVGGLVGSAYDTSINDSYATGDVSGAAAVGGLVGDVGSGLGPVSDSYATGDVSGQRSVGGLIGGRIYSDASSYGGPISDSYATGDVSGESTVGGLIGAASGETIRGSYATGAVTGSGDRVGGLIGLGRDVSISGSYSTGTVISGGNLVGGLAGQLEVGPDRPVAGNYATGHVSGENRVGGLVGLFGGGGDLQASYATGDVSGAFRVGGLLGQSGVNTSYSYSIGNVSGTGVVGGLIGEKHRSVTVTESFWDTVTSGQAHSNGGTGLTTSELQSPAGYTGIYASWNVDLDNQDRDNNQATGTDDPWDFGTSSQYPVLKYGGLSVADQRR